MSPDAMKPKSPTYHLKADGHVAACGRAATWPTHAVVPEPVFAKHAQRYDLKVCAACKLIRSRSGSLTLT